MKKDIMDQVEEIKQKLDIVDIVKSYLDLQKAGVNYKARCPFHQEKTPSFMVNPERQIFKCFGCNKSGDIFSFVQEMEGIDFPDALKLLADRAGVKLKQVDQKYYQEKKDLYQANELAVKLFQYLLTKDEVGKKALKYLKERKITPAMIKQFNLGYAPNSWETLTSFLRKKGYDSKMIVQAGLGVESQRDNSIYDRFRGRVMFPISNPAGRVVGFSSRILPQFDDGKMGKYINSPDSSVFNKSKVLYGYDFSRNEIRKKKTAVLVEGQFDVITSHQAGFKNTIATSGTALTDDQAKMISRIADRLIYAYDWDEAGQEATKKGIEIALNNNLEVRVAIIPKGYQDVDEVVRDKPKKWLKAINQAKEIIDYYFSQTIPADATKLSSVEKRKIGQTLVRQISKIDDPIIQGDWIQRLSEKLLVDPQSLYQALDNAKSSIKTTKSPAPTGQKNISREKRLLGLWLTFPELYDKMKKQINPDFFADPRLKKIFSTFRKKGLSSFKDDQKVVVDGLIMEVEGEYEKEDRDMAQAEINQVLKNLQQQRKEKLKKEFAGLISQAEKKGDRKEVKQLIKKFQKIISDE